MKLGPEQGPGGLLEQATQEVLVTGGETVVQVGVVGPGSWERAQAQRMGSWLAQVGWEGDGQLDRVEANELGWWELKEGAWAWLGAGLPLFYFPFISFQIYHFFFHFSCFQELKKYHIIPTK